MKLYGSLVYSDVSTGGLHPSAIAQNLQISLIFRPAARSLRHVLCAHLCASVNLNISNQAPKTQTRKKDNWLRTVYLSVFANLPTTPPVFV